MSKQSPRPLVERAETVVPGHGGPHIPEAALRIIDEDLGYLDALERGEERPKLPNGRDSLRQRMDHLSRHRASHTNLLSRDLPRSPVNMHAGARGVE